jgi:hypothetical protein
MDKHSTYYTVLDALKAAKECPLCVLEADAIYVAGAKAIISKIGEKGIRALILTGARAEAAVKVGKDCGMMKESAAHLVGKTIETPLKTVIMIWDFLSLNAMMIEC